MELSEKLYTLRKKSGRSQEQIAEQLNVSRQAISKRETGQSVPESDKLLAISSYFNVSLDYLLKETDDQTDSSVDHQDGTTSTNEQSSSVSVRYNHLCYRYYLFDNLGSFVHR